MTNQQKLDEARQARHDILTGKKVRVFLDQNGERVEFVTANLAALDAYIRELEKLINPSVPYSNRPIGFTF